MKKRCDWSVHDPLCTRYHDEEWGVPEYDDQTLFAKLLLDGAQAGLSWLTILKKRKGYYKAFEGFDPEAMARFDERKIRSLIANRAIIRNRLKIEAAVANAQAFIKMKDEGVAFASFLWDFAGGAPLHNHWKHIAEVPSRTEASEQMSRSLKARGFRFVGPTICYAFMQAVGMVNDHLVDCFRHRELMERSKSAPPFSLGR